MSILKTEKQLNDLIVKVKKSIESTIGSETEILKTGKSERNFTTSLVREISKKIKEQDILVDPFYNKHIRAAKRLDGRLIELDIAIHERYNDKNNLVAIELETNNYPVGDDLWKVKSLTKELDGYGYELGLYLVIGIGKKAGQIITMKWYRNGEIMVI